MKKNNDTMKIYFIEYKFILIEKNYIIYILIS